MILHYPLTLFRYLLHIGDLLQKALVLVVVLDFNLLEGVVVVLDGGGVDVRIASAQLLLHFDVLKAVVALKHGVVREKIKHLISYYNSILEISAHAIARFWTALVTCYSMRLRWASTIKIL